MTTEQYNPKQLEKSAQDYWDQHQTFKAIPDKNKEKYYCLSMFPYPSGNIHIGHVRNYTIGDVISRYQRMLGKNVLQPFGWDAFGLPAENAAIANQLSPALWTYENIKKTKSQLKSLGLSYDWSREITTCKPDYYRWEQWFFTRLFNEGVAYKKPSVVNWCDHDKTVLANEQVIDGACWRCDTKVRQVELNQWFLAISKFSQELLDGLKSLDQWPDQVKSMQENWIGRSEGLEFSFEVEGVPRELRNLKVFTTRVDTIYGVSYISVAATHPLSLHAAQNNSKLADFIENSRHVKTAEADLATMEKAGVDTGLSVIHPLTGKLIPIFAANFVLMTYGTGAVMSVPAHDDRDFEFAQKYNLPIIGVIKPQNPAVEFSLPYAAEGVLHSSSDFDGLTTDQARKAIADKIISLGIGEYKVNYRLRDWGLSRQRYWGAPIPILSLENGEIVAVPDEELPVVLPEDIVLNGIENPLLTDSSWNQTTYKGQVATREMDTFDTFMESSWYYARYTSPHCDTAMIDSEEANYWLPVDQYIGGIEHATMHLIYSRFFHKLLRNHGLVNCDEPFTKMVCQGMVLNNSYYYQAANGERVWVKTKDVIPELDNKRRIIGGRLKTDNTKCVYAGMIKMSKSKNNGVDPNEIIDLYGADAIRLFIMFAAPIESTLEWQDSGIEGAHRFLKRVWNLTIDFISRQRREKLVKAELNQQQQKLRYELHRTIAKVNDDIARRQSINTAIASIMELLNHLTKAKLEEAQDFALMEEAINAVVLMLYPITPHICFELWKRLGHTDLIDFHPIVQHDESALKTDTKLIVVQVNGKIRAKLEVDYSVQEAQIKELVHANKAVQKYLTGTIVKEIYVADKLYNIVVK